MTQNQAWMFVKANVIATLVVCCSSLVVGPAFAQNAEVPVLVSADWSATAPVSLSGTPPAAADVTDLLNYLQDSLVQKGGPFSTCSFRFANLRNSGVLSLVITANWASDYCNTVYIVDRSSSGFEINQLPIGAKWCCGDIGQVVQDLDGDGIYELVVDNPFTWDQGRNHCSAVWPIVYGWTGTEYADVSGKFMDYYRQQISSLEQKTPGDFTAPCVSAEIAKLKRISGIDKTAGLAEAIKWSESEDPHVRGFAAALLADIGTHEALDDLKTLSHDTDQGVARDADYSMKYRAGGKGPKYRIDPVSVSTPALGWRRAASGRPVATPVPPQP